MMSGATIAAMSRKAASSAAKAHKKPYQVWPDDLRDWKAGIESGNPPKLPFPFLGSHIPKGWERTSEFFVDASGFGADYEPALTIKQFVSQIKENYGYAITEAGQFQVYIAEYRKVD